MFEWNRRKVLQSASAAALLLYLEGFKSWAAVAALSKRSVINTNLLAASDYQFINHFLNSNQFGPFGKAWTTGPVWNRSILDKSGYPSSELADNRGWGCGIRVPASSDFSGPYVLTWEGEGQVAFLAGTWTVNARSSTRYAETKKGVWTGSNPRIVMDYTGARLLFPVQVIRTGGATHGSFCRNLRFFRLEDEKDLLAGRIFRRPYKRTLADLHPGAIRFMNWTGSNSSYQCRFEHRTLPGNATYSGYNWVASPPYAETTGVNQYALAAVKGTPASMQHGEIATCRIGASAARNGSKKILSITNANPGVVTSAAHGFEEGDVVVHQISAGMTELDYKPIKIRNVTKDTYELGLDTSSYHPFTQGMGTAKQYITLDIGGRGSYPVIFGDGTTPASNYGDGYIAKGDYKTFHFDKTLVASTEIAGAWIFNDAGASNGFGGGVPLEVCTALVNELMEMIDPSKGPINMWITVPHRALLSMDPDYQQSSNWATNAVDTILNGANGYAGLDHRSDLLVEYSNETWNFGGSAFSQTFYLTRRGFLRWPHSGRANTADFSTLRSVIMVEDIKAAFPRNSRIKFVLCGQGTVGVQGGNSVRINGSPQFRDDVLNKWRSSPIDHFDYFGWAAYFSPPVAFDKENLPNMAAFWLAADGDALRQEAICASYVDGIVGKGTGETTSRYGKVLLPAYASAMAAKGKATIMYEGGWDRSTSNGTKEQNAFLVACKRSQAWANAMKNFFDLFKVTDAAGYPADYIELGDRWGHAWPDLYGDRVEGAGLDKAWFAIQQYNKDVN